MASTGHSTCDTQAREPPAAAPGLPAAVLLATSGVGWRLNQSAPKAFGPPVSSDFIHKRLEGAVPTFSPSSGSQMSRLSHLHSSPAARSCWTPPFQAADLESVLRAAPCGSGAGGVIDGGEGVVRRWGSHSLGIYQQLIRRPASSQWEVRVFCSLFRLLVFIPLSLSETSGSALSLPRFPLAVPEVSIVPSPKTPGVTDLGVSLLLKAKVVGGQLYVPITRPCGLFRQAGGSRPAPESTACLPGRRTYCPAQLLK